MQLTRQHFILIGPLFALALYYFLQVYGVAYLPGVTAAITLLTVI
jgi:sodium-dependent dicarboxylate transporter 2/3/5